MRLKPVLHGAAVYLLLPVAWAREPDLRIPVWPGSPPGETRAAGPERRLEGRPRPFYQLTDVSAPALEVFLPPSPRRLPTAVLVCPGGGFQRLAYEHEGLEVAEWLDSRDLAAFVLKYRVPATPEVAAQDAQRALRILRARAGEWGLDPDAVGVLGFSAGGEIAAWLASHAETALYPAIDAVDAASARPDFVAMIYPGGLLAGREGGLKRILAEKVRPGMPPAFVVHAFDDASENSLQWVLALQRARVPAELHLFQEGGHGFGVRATGVPVGSWKDLFGRWLGSLGHRDPARVRAYVLSLAEAMTAGRAAPRFTASAPDASLDEAYAAQRRRVRQVAHSDPIAGFKAAAASAAAQAALGVDRPLVAAIHRSGRLDGSQRHALDLATTAVGVVETEIGFVTSVDISYEILNDHQARGAVQSVVPIVELPRNLGWPQGAANARDLVAANVGSARYIVGPALPAADLDPDALEVSLARDGQVLHTARGSTVKGGQWRHLRGVLNEITGHGYTLPAGSLILGGALGAIHPARPGRYTAEYGGLGRIEFELR